MEHKCCCDVCPECGGAMKDGRCLACGQQAKDCDCEEAEICPCCGKPMEECECS